MARPLEWISVDSRTDAGSEMAKYNKPAPPEAAMVISAVLERMRDSIPTSKIERPGAIRSGLVCAAHEAAWIKSEIGSRRIR